MNIDKRPKQSGKSILTRGFRDLGTPQGLTLFKAIMLCAIISIALDTIGKKIGISTDLLYPIIIAIIVIIFVVIVIRMSAMSKKTLEKQREEHRRKLEGKDK
jgi:hypothetical protein